MRVLVLMAVLVIVSAPFATAAPNPIPAMTIHLEPTTQTVNASVASVNASYDGEVKVDKMQYQTVTVTLTSGMNNGWTSSVTPAEMTFSSSNSQTFKVYVLVPAGTTGITGTLTVNASGRTNLFTVVQSTSVVLIASGTPKPPANQTNGTGQPSGTDSGNQTGSGGSGSVSGGGLFGLSKQNTYILTAAIVVGVFAAAGSGIALVRRKRRSRQMA